MSNRTKLALIVIAVIVIAYAFFAFDIPYKKGDGPAAGDTNAINTSKVIIDSPQSGALVSSPLSMGGKALGGWFFEASFPIQVLDASGKVLGQGHATAQGEWMISGLVPWTASVSFAIGSSTSGVIRLMKDNPSGDPSRDEHIDVPVNFK